MKQNIAIIGCGWLGRPLAHHLLSLGFGVTGSTRSNKKAEQLKNEGIDATVLQLNETSLKGDTDNLLGDATQAIINIPPGLRKNPNKNHVGEIEQLIKKIEASDVKHVVFFSSTSVFQNKESFPVITKDTLPNATSKTAIQLTEIEKKLRANSHFKTTILRPSGLIGKDRHPGTVLAGRKNISDPKAPVNLIHREDVIRVTSKILKEKYWGYTLNLAMPQHPTKKEYYENYAKKNGLIMPQFNLQTESKGKIIDSRHEFTALHYILKHYL